MQMTREQAEMFRASLEVIEALKQMDADKLEQVKTMVKEQHADIQRWFDACMAIAQK